MFEGLKEAMDYYRGLVVESEKIEVKEINGRTYANKKLNRYDSPEYATAVQASTLTAMVDYIWSCSKEFPGEMLVHIVSPTKVRLISTLDSERNRETLFETNAEVSGFDFNTWYDQERFMIEMQANFQDNDDRKAVLKMAGNVERKNNQIFTDNGTDQVVEMQVGVAAKANALVPNPVELIPYRTFQAVDQPASKFVFRVGDKEVPAFKIVEAEGGIWKNEAIRNIKEFLIDHLNSMPDETKNKITVIG